MDGNRHDSWRCFVGCVRRSHVDSLRPSETPITIGRDRFLTRSFYAALRSRRSPSSKCRGLQRDRIRRRRGPRPSTVPRYSWHFQRPRMDPGQSVRKHRTPSAFTGLGKIAGVGPARRDPRSRSGHGSRDASLGSERAVPSGPARRIRRLPRTRLREDRLDAPCGPH